MQTRFSTSLQIANDGSQVAAIAILAGRTQMRLGVSATRAAATLVNDFPELLEPVEVMLPTVSAEPIGLSVTYTPHATADDQARINLITQREMEVIALIATEGMRNQTTAERLNISVITVRHHLSAIFAKLEVKDRFEMCFFAWRTGMVRPPWLSDQAFARANAAQQNSTSEPALADVS